MPEDADPTIFLQKLAVLLILLGVVVATVVLIGLKPGPPSDQDTLIMVLASISSTVAMLIVRDSDDWFSS